MLHKLIIVYPKLEIRKLVSRFPSDTHTSCFWFLKYCLVLQGLPVSRSSRVNEGIKQEFVSTVTGFPFSHPQKGCLVASSQKKKTGAKVFFVFALFRSLSRYFLFHFLVYINYK